ncbi:MAG: c-type cytochrome [Planctomycetes bacterium]|nr:c-type cytochrome [Planctomycetota bacterium]
MINETSENVEPKAASLAPFFWSGLVVTTVALSIAVFNTVFTDYDGETKIQEGQRYFDRSCNGCHEVDGRGGAGGGHGPSLTGYGATLKMRFESDEAARNFLREKILDPAMHASEDNVDFRNLEAESTLRTDIELEPVIDYVLSLDKNKGVGSRE